MEQIAKRLTDSFIEGLSKEDHNSSIKMFVTYVHSLPDRSEVGEYLALDLGGSNFRVLKNVIKEMGQLNKRQLQRSFQMTRSRAHIKKYCLIT